LDDARTAQEEDTDRLRDELRNNPDWQAQTEHGRGWELAREEAEEATGPIREKLASIRAAHPSGYSSDSQTARDIADLTAHEQRVRMQRLEAFGYSLQTAQPIDTLRRLRVHVERLLLYAKISARAVRRTYDSHNFTEDNRETWEYARKIYATCQYLPCPPQPNPISEPHYLDRLHHWCLEGEARPESEEMAEVDAFREDVQVCDTALQQYASMRAELFRQLILLTETPGGPWKIEYKRDLKKGDGSVPFTTTFQIVDAKEIKGEPFDGVGHVTMTETYAPFYSFTLYDADGNNPSDGTAAKRIEVKLAYLLNRLLVVIKILVAKLTVLEGDAKRFNEAVDVQALSALLVALPVFPYWPRFTRDKTLYDATLAEERPLIHTARTTLRALHVHANPVGPDASSDPGASSEASARAAAESRWPTMGDLVAEAGISNDTFGRVRKLAGIEVELKGGAARNRRYSPKEVTDLIDAAARGNFMERRKMQEKWKRWTAR